MAAELIVTPEAKQDIDEVYDWYERRRVGLGEDFLGRVDACIEAICRTPEMVAKVFGDYRRGVVRRFPYAVFYEYDAGDRYVYCIFHTARDPKKWQARLS